MGIEVGEPFVKDRGTWLKNCWVTGGGNLVSVAVRQRRDDEQWYVTQGYAPCVEVLFGPLTTVEAAEMLLNMGVIDVKER